MLSLAALLHGCSTKAPERVRDLHLPSTLYLFVLGCLAPLLVEDPARLFSESGFSKGLLLFPPL
jgi:hypothetical protein